jgi:hypothetical protein
MIQQNHAPITIEDVVERVLARHPGVVPERAPTELEPSKPKAQSAAAGK